jgi:hypothetical protein
VLESKLICGSGPSHHRSARGEDRLGEQKEEKSVERREAATRPGIDPEIRIARNGPYIVTNVNHLTDWLGQELPLQPENRVVPMRAIA